jgi:hypothetical protein
MSTPIIGSARYERETAGARTLGDDGDPLDIISALRHAMTAVTVTKFTPGGVMLIDDDGTLVPLNHRDYRPSEIREICGLSDEISDSEVVAWVAAAIERLTVGYGFETDDGPCFISKASAKRLDRIELDDTR